MSSPRVWAEVDLGNIAWNLQRVRAHVGERVKIMVVVKADAYGHGSVPVTWTCLQGGADMVGVGNSGEAIELREAGVTAPILILGAIIEGEVATVIEYGISSCVHTASRLDILEREARRQGRVARVHLLIDTGMGRLGASPREAPALFERIRKSRRVLQLEGVATHFAESGVGDTRGATAAQLGRFLESLSLDPAAPRDFLMHASNSGAIFMPGIAHLDMVRPGIAIYGIRTPALPSDLDLRPALAMRSQIIFLKEVPAGSPIGYNGRHVTKRRTKVATVPVGYNDGYHWRLSEQAEVLVRGKRAPVIGSVTMDYLMVDATDIVPVLVGDTVTLIGRDGDEVITASEIAERAGTIPYEVTCSLGMRVKRIYGGGATSWRNHASPRESGKPGDV